MGKASNNASFASKPKTLPPPKKDNPAKDTICHQCGLRGSKKLKPGALSLYVGDSHRAAVEATGTYHLELHSGLVIVFKKEVKNQLEKTIKTLRSDRGGEYMSQEFLDYLTEHGIITHRTPPYMPQNNGVSERMNRTLLDMVRSMMSQTTLPKSFWDYALETAARILNMVSTKKVDKTPYEIWHGQAPKLSYLIVWGYLKASRSVEDLKLIQEEDRNPSVDTSLNHEEDDQEIDEPQSDINPIRKSSRTRRAPDRMCLYIDAEEHELGDLGEPANYKATLLDPESKKWLDAMNVEIKWLFKKKTDMDGAVYIFKARLVAKGFTQTCGVDYEETFSPVADIRAIRILIAIVAYYDYEIWQMNRSIYGLKQASRQWNKRFDVEIKKFGFTQNPYEPCVYLKASGSYIAILILYVDDILLMGNNIPMLQDVKSHLGRSFAMKDLGEAAYILGIKIYRDRTILMQKKLKLSKSQESSEEHWTAVKNILKYLYNTKDMFLVYGGNMEQELRVFCYTNAVYLTDADNLKSQTGYVFVLNGGAVDWKSTKQSIFATSSTDAEYIAAFDASKKAVWIHKFISGLGIVFIFEEPISMYCDNTGAIAITKDDGVTKGARHFRAKVYYLRKSIKLGDIKIEKIDTNDNLADPL
nr:hypothetical protein [Tanacetum cinerariifolium]